MNLFNDLNHPHILPHLHNVVMYCILKQIEGFCDSRKDVSIKIEENADPFVHYFSELRAEVGACTMHANRGRR